MNSADDRNQVNEATPTRILIIRPSAIGDLVMASAMLEPLRQAHPHARISWLIEPQIRDVLAGNSCLDQLIDWPKQTWTELWRTRQYRTLWRELRAFRGTLRQERFDLVLDVQGLLRSRLLAWLSGGRNRIGFSSKEPGERLMTKIISRGSDSDRMGSEYRHMLHELGVPPGDFHPCIEVQPQARDAATDLLGQAGIEGQYAVFAPFTTRPQKHWLPDRWCQLAREVRQRLQLPVVLLGGPGDRPAAEQMVANSAAAAVSLAGQASLATSVAVVARAALLIGVDTGLTHMGPAFDCPTLALFGATCPYLYTSRCNTAVLYSGRDCSPCKRSPTCDGRFDCMVDLSVADVLARSQSVLQAGRVWP